MTSINVLKPLTPIFYWILMNIATGFSLAVPPSIRLATLPAILLPAYYAFTTSSYLVWPQGYSQVQALFALLGASHFLSILYIRKWTLHSHGIDDKELQAKHEVNFLSSQTWKRMYRITVTTQWSETKHVASRKPFRLSRVLRLLLCLSIQYYITNFSQGIPSFLLPLGPTDFAPQHQVYLRRIFFPGYPAITAKETLLRAGLTILTYWTTILMVETVHVLLAIFFIFIVRWDTPNDWRDLFGHPCDAFTVGRFWGTFWHHSHVSAHRDWATLIMRLIPAWVRNVPIINRTVRLFLIFAISGVIHALVSYQGGDTCAYMTDVWFFLRCFAAVYVEGLVAYLWRMGRARVSNVKNEAREEEKEEEEKEEKKEEEKEDYKGKATSKHQAGVPLVVRCVGYIYVFGFFFWAVPKCAYPKMYCPFERIMSMFQWNQSGSVGG